MRPGLEPRVVAMSRASDRVRDTNGASVHPSGAVPFREERPGARTFEGRAL